MYNCPRAASVTGERRRLSVPHNCAGRRLSGPAPVAVHQPAGQPGGRMQPRVNTSARHLCRADLRRRISARRQRALLPSIPPTPNLPTCHTHEHTTPPPQPRPATTTPATHPTAPLFCLPLQPWPRASCGVWTAPPSAPWWCTPWRSGGSATRPPCAAWPCSATSLRSSWPLWPTACTRRCLRWVRRAGTGLQGCRVTSQSVPGSTAGCRR